MDVTSLTAILGALGVAYLSFMATRTDRRLAQFESSLITQAEIRERVRAHDIAIAELRSEAMEVRGVLSKISEELAFIRATVQKR